MKTGLNNAEAVARLVAAHAEGKELQFYDGTIEIGCDAKYFWFSYMCCDVENSCGNNDFEHWTTVDALQSRIDGMNNEWKPYDYPGH